MIAMLLAAQLATGIAHGLPMEASSSPNIAMIAPHKGDLLQPRSRPSNCFGGAGRMEVSFAEPAALYRKGDRPAHGLRNWVDFPEGSLCLVGTGQ
ncbi:hypothetical protein [Phenylobacterium sp.]|jgi:hypothetical protein|uniref:hypothetical protein n=1 Tax=Phenylobacterium sp. TaxID=1871053 RepID=UPI002F40D07F